MTYKCISIIEAEAIIEKDDATILDMRDPASFAAGNIQNSFNVSNQNVEDIVYKSDKSKPLVWMVVMRFGS